MSANHLSSFFSLAEGRGRGGFEDRGRGRGFGGFGDWDRGRGRGGFGFGRGGFGDWNQPGNEVENIEDQNPFADELNPFSENNAPGTEQSTREEPQEAFSGTGPSQELTNSSELASGKPQSRFDAPQQEFLGQPSQPGTENQEETEQKNDGIMAQHGVDHQDGQMEINPGVSGQQGIMFGATEETGGRAVSDEGHGKAEAIYGQHVAERDEQRLNVREVNAELSENKLQVPEELAPSHHEPESSELVFEPAQHEERPNYPEPAEHMALNLREQDNSSAPEAMPAGEPLEQMVPQQQEVFQSGQVIENQLPTVVEHEVQEPSQPDLPNLAAEVIEGTGETSSEKE